MAKKFLTNLDLVKNQILNVALHNLPSAPSSPVDGQVYYNTVDDVPYYWDGTTWKSMGGDITDVIAGNGLTGGGSTGSVTLDLNVDNVTLEVSGDVVRIKDLGVTTDKLADNAATTIKITDKNITFAKIQDVATMTVLGKVTAGSGSVTEVSIINDLTSGAGSTNLATAGSIKTYIDSVVGGLGNLEGGFNASSGSFPIGSSPVSGTNTGDYWYVTAAGTIDGMSLTIGDVIIAITDNASTSSAADWIALEVNRGQATTAVLGLVTLATDAETQTGVDSVKVVTPAGLSSRTATESRTGIAEIATQSETDTGTDDERIVTPLKLKTLLDNRTGGYATDLTGSSTSYAITHGLSTKDVIVEVYENATGETVYTDVVRTSTSVVTIGFAIAPSSNQYRVVIKK